MKFPEGVPNSQGTKALVDVQLRSSDGKALREYGIMNEGVYTSCLALTSPGDVITVPFVLEPGVADFVDLVVDGIRRDSATSSGADKNFARSFRRVCYQERLQRGKRGGLKSCAMEIMSRNAEKDIAWKGDGLPSAVGTLEVQLFKIVDVARQAADTSSQGNISKDLLATIKRAPTFAEYASWNEVNPFIDLSGSPPSFEMGFTDKHQLDKFKVERVLKEWPGQCKFIAGFKFKFCSTADLLALGYKDVPTYYVSSRFPTLENSSEMNSRPNTLAAPSFNIDNENGMHKATDNDNSTLFVEDLEAGGEAEPRITTDMRFEAKNGFNHPQHPTINSVSQSLIDNKRQYLQKQYMLTESEPILKVERAPYSPPSVHYSPSRHQTTCEYDSTANCALLNRRDLRERIMQSTHYYNHPGNLSGTATSLSSQVPRENDYQSFSPLSAPSGVRNQSSDFATRQKMHEYSAKFYDPSERLEVLNQANGSSRVAERSCRSLPCNSPESPMSKTSAITEHHHGPMVTSAKRKADNINNDTPDACKESRKARTPPALRTSADSDQGLTAARIRLAVAKKRKAELAEALENAMHSNTIRRLNQVAEQIEKENLELQAKLDALYSNEEDI